MRPGALLAAAVFAAACAHAPARGPRLVAVSAEGWSPVVKGDPVGTRRRALAAALRAAVEQSAGVNVSARTRVERLLAVDDVVTARTEGAVRSYKVLSEAEGDGFHKTWVRAEVEVRPMDASAAPDARPGPPPGDPKVSVSLKGPSGDAAAAGVRRALIERGFTVVDGTDADIAVSGTVAVVAKGAAGPFSSSRARVALTARQARGGRVLWASGKEASGVGPGGTAAELKASETAGLLGGEELAREVAARLAD